MKVGKIHEKVPSMSPRLQPQDWHSRVETNIEMFSRVKILGHYIWLKNFIPGRKFRFVHDSFFFHDKKIWRKTNVYDDNECLFSTNHPSIKIGNWIRSILIHFKCLHYIDIHFYRNIWSDSEWRSYCFYFNDWKEV